MVPWAALLILFLRAAPGLTPEAAGVSHPGGIPAAWDDYAWPTEAGRIVTSTFGEYRPSHFHAGIDISSGDVQGYGVFASRSGYVSRIRVSPTGYGKILYIRHPDGFTTTYAHLERFSPALDARALAEQMKLGRYPVDIDCPPREFPVRKGDLIAHTGETGAASPHLHFEIRDPAGDPVNPFLAPRLQVHDDIPPTITRIAVSPLSPDGTVDGTHEARIYTVRPAGPGGHSMRIVQPIVITGEAGFALDSRDRIPGSRFRNGVYARTLEIDGKEAYRERLDRTPWDEAHEIELCYEHGLPGGGRFARLYMNSPNHLSFYLPRGVRAGVIDCASLPPGPHTFRIVSADFQGNSAEVTGIFVASRVPAGSAERMGDTLRLRLFDPADVTRIDVAVQIGRGDWSVRSLPPPAGGFTGTFLLPPGYGERGALSVTLENRWGTRSHPIVLPARAQEERTLPSIHLSFDQEEEYALVRVTADGILPSPPEVTVQEGAGRTTVVMTAASPLEYAGWFTPREAYRGAHRILASCTSGAARALDSMTVDIEPVLPGTSGTLAFDGGRLLVRYDSLSVLRTLFLRVERREGDDGEVYTLEPEGTVLGSGLLVTILPAPGKTHRGLFSRTGGSWQFIGGRGGTAPCTGRVRGRLAEVTLIADSTAPALLRISVARRTGTGPEVTARFRDDISGVEYDDLKMYIDGNLVIPEIDGRRRRAVYQVRDIPARGAHRLTVQLADRMGNSRTTERQFVLP